MFLDEPMNGLDPEGIAELRDLLIELNQKDGITVLISSHILSELEKQITTLARKYATSYSDLTEQLATAQTELSALVADLTGDEFALKGLQELNK